MRDNMATNKVYCSYQEIIDLHTEPEKVTAIGIHTPTDDTPYKMFEGFFKQFKKYKYIGASVSLVPVATLPIDPLQVEFPGNEGVDPRDIMNPVLFHGCHGEDMGTVLNMLIGRDTPISDSLIGMQGNNADGAPTSEYLLYSLLDELYYKALTDRTWRKAHPQRGFKKSGLRPLLYTLATNRQVAPGSLSDVLGFNDDDDVVAFGGDPTIADRTIINPVTGTEITVPTYATKNNMQLMTPRLTRLGYLDTRMLVTDFTPGVATVDTMVTSENWTRLPKLMMGLILLPPSYKVEMHFRMIINHYWTFKGFRGISFRNDLLKSPSYFNANDNLFANESGNGNPIPEEIGGDTPLPDPDDPDDPVSGAVILMHQTTKDTGKDFRFWTESALNTLPVFSRCVFEDDTSVESGQQLGANAAGYINSVNIVGFGVINNTIRLVAYVARYSVDDGLTVSLYCYLNSSNQWVDVSAGTVVSTDAYPSAITAAPILTSEQRARFVTGIDATGATLDTSSWS